MYKEWEERPEVKKGNIGEKIVQELLTQMGFLVYKPITPGSHKIDFFAHSGKEKNVICAEAKCKRRMAYYTRTGFNYDCYLHYKEMEIKHNIRTFVFFIDDFEGCVYGQWLDKLGEGNRMGGEMDDVYVWDLSKMKVIRELTPEEIKSLSEVTNEYYDYSKVVKYFSNA